MQVLDFTGTHAGGGLVGRGSKGIFNQLSNL